MDYGLSKAENIEERAIMCKRGMFWGAARHILGQAE